MQNQFNRLTPRFIMQLAPKDVFVFGSNTQGRHGAGAAKQAMQFGAQYGVPQGPQGQTYGIVTKDLSLGRRGLPVQQVQQNIHNFIDYAEGMPDRRFLVTPIGTGLAGYTPDEMMQPFRQRYQALDQLPGNIWLPSNFVNAGYYNR